MNSAPNKALFLDRDGVINEEVNYLHTIDECRFIDGIFELAKAAVEKGYIIVVVTNQAGIGRGYYTVDDFNILMDYISGEFADASAPLTAVYHCPYHPTEGVGEYLKDSEFRKPKPGMIFQAQREHNIDLSQSLLLGDRETDIEVAHNAGINTSILFDAENKSADTAASFTVTNLKDVIQYL